MGDVGAVSVAAAARARRVGGVGEREVRERDAGTRDEAADNDAAAPRGVDTMCAAHGVCTVIATGMENVAPWHPTTTPCSSRRRQAGPRASSCPTGAQRRARSGPRVPRRGRTGATPPAAVTARWGRRRRGAPHRVRVADPQHHVGGAVGLQVSGGRIGTPRRRPWTGLIVDVDASAVPLDDVVTHAKPSGERECGNDAEQPDRAAAAGAAASGAAGAGHPAPLTSSALVAGAIGWSSGRQAGCARPRRRGSRRARAAPARAR